MITKKYRMVMEVLIVSVLVFAQMAMASYDNRASSGSRDINICQQASDFILSGSAGVDRRLSDFHGRYVILEWVDFSNEEVRRQYESGAMQKAQTAFKDKGVIWLSICSASPGAEGYFSGVRLRQRLADEDSRASDYLIDSDGIVADHYGVDAIPRLILIDPDGYIIYSGSVEDIPPTKTPETGEAAAALQLVLENHRARK